MELTERVTKDKCPLCRLEATTQLDGLMMSHGVGPCWIATKCVRCGSFSITWEALTEVDRLGAAAIISGLAREWTELARPIEITLDNLASLANLAPKTLREKRRKFLQALTRKFPRLNCHCYLNSSIDYTLAYTWSPDEFGLLKQYMLDEGVLQYVGVQDRREVYLVKPRGWEEVDAIEKPAALRQKAFVAMWFNELVQPAYHEGIAPAIEETGYRPIRIDLQEHSDSVIDRIIAEIKEARFVIADFTGHRGGVYFEAGFARGLGLNVIWTCKNDHLDQLHFDIRGFNVIVWTSPADLRERLNARIRAIVGYGPLHDATKAL